MICTPHWILFRWSNREWDGRDMKHIWERGVEHTGFWCEKPEGKRPLGRPRYRGEDNNKMDLQMPPSRKLQSKDWARSWILHSYHTQMLTSYAALMWKWIQFTRYSHFLITAIALLNIPSVSRCLPKQQLHVHLAISTGHFCKFAHNEDRKFGQFL